MKDVHFLVAMDVSFMKEEMLTLLQHSKIFFIKKAVHGSNSKKNSEKNMYQSRLIWIRLKGDFAQIKSISILSILFTLTCPFDILVEP